MGARPHVLGGFSLDAVRYADGTYDVNRQGGNAFWAALGARLAGATPCVHAVVGGDYPEGALRSLASAGIDVRNVVRRHDLPSTRVTFTYTADGSRTQPADPTLLGTLPVRDRQRFIDNTGLEDLLLTMLPSTDDIDDVEDGRPGSVEGQHWYLGLLPALRLRELAAHLRGADYVQIDCPERSELRRDGYDVLREVLPSVDTFSPSTSDAAVFLPGDRPLDLLATFHGWGARAVVLKCGEDGALVSVGGRCWHVPIFLDPHEFDPTGAGDVFGGACAGVMATSGDLVAAAVAGATAASFATAARGPLDLTAVRSEDYEARRRFIASRVEEI
jgi:sugar/nucleoside kinase (ribokinase family)